MNGDLYDRLKDATVELRLATTEYYESPQQETVRRKRALHRVRQVREKLTALLAEYGEA